MPAIAPSITIEAKKKLPKSHFNASFYGNQLSNELNASKAGNAELQLDDKCNHNLTHFDVSSIPTELILEHRVYGKAYLRLERDLENEGDDEVTTDFDRKIITNPHQIRDEINFMSALHKNLQPKLALNDDFFHKHQPLKVYGNEQNTSLIPDESQLSVKTQLADRLDSSFSRRQVRQLHPGDAWRDTKSKTNMVQVRNALEGSARNKAKFFNFITGAKRNLTSGRDSV